MIVLKYVRFEVLTEVVVLVFVVCATNSRLLGYCTVSLGK
jgi:hypothetical protein